MTEDQAKKESGDACGCGTQRGGGGKWIWIILALAIVAVFLAKSPCHCKPPKGANQSAMAIATNTSAAVTAAVAKGATAELASQTKALPRLVDLGATKCIPCKMMAPILEDLKKTYAGQIDVQFIDVWENQDAGSPYGIKIIPTQIFFDTEGKELFRHEGFLSKEDIMAKWKEFGVELGNNSVVRSQNPE